ncbi:BolA-like protein 3, partial [Spheniscus magellanicus]
RSFTSQTDGEARVTRVLREKFPRASAIRVVDISAQLRACGAWASMRATKSVAARIHGAGACLLQALSEEIKSMHGLRIFTSTPKP